MYRTVIVPLDGSLFGEQALPTAASLALRSGATLELVRVHQAYPFALGYASKWNELLRQDEGDYLARTAADVGQRFGAAASTLLLDGLAVEAICARAARVEAPLVVMSTHGRTGFSRMWLGSIAAGVMHHTDQPVLMLRPEADEAGMDAASRRFEQMLVPLDGSELAEQVLPHAMSLAQAMNGAVLLLRVVEQVHPLPAYPLPNLPVAELPSVPLDVLVQRASEYTSSVAGRLGRAFPTVRIATDVRVADSAARAILASAEAQGADIVALASHGRGLSRYVLGSVADKVIRGGPGSILVVRAHHD